MKNKELFLLLILLCYGCQTITKEDVLNNISGYWEIQKVILKDDIQKEYKVSTTVDFIKIITDQKGFRKKLQPNLTGKFYGSDDVEQFKILENNEGLWLQYETTLMNWKEKIIDVDKETLILQNENGTTYVYKRYKPLEILE